MGRPLFFFFFSAPRALPLLCLLLSLHVAFQALAAPTEHEHPHLTALHELLHEHGHTHEHTHEHEHEHAHGLHRGHPTVTLDAGVFTGASELHRSGRVHKFLGIPYAQPPVGPLRFSLPLPNTPYSGAYSARAFAPACPQQRQRAPPATALARLATEVIEHTLAEDGARFAEDCLHLNVVVPEGAAAAAAAGEGVPVVVFLFGGGFEFGTASRYDGGKIVKRSVELGMPVIYVSVEYRVSAFGFLASEEVRRAGVGNLGLQDQRQAFRWVQKYISAFGGDPGKVTVWGQSAGAISIALHLLAPSPTDAPLFRAAFMQSGGPPPVGDIAHGQPHYDALVADVGCAGRADTLACLRDAPYESVVRAMDRSPGLFGYQSLHAAWLPRVDGVFLNDTPMALVQAGRIADVPLVVGNCDDEATIFSLQLKNITTDAQFQQYIHTNYVPAASPGEMARLAALYPDDPRAGAPFGTGTHNVYAPQYKRLAALQGDFTFHMARRHLLNGRAAGKGTSRAWSYLSKRHKDIPDIGAAHGTDLLLNIFHDGDLTDYLVRFATHLDPNGPPSDDAHAASDITDAASDDTDADADADDNADAPADDNADDNADAPADDNADDDPADADTPAGPVRGRGIAWPAYDTTSRSQLTLLDGQTPARIEPDTYRAEQMEYLVQLALEYPL